MSKWGAPSVCPLIFSQHHEHAGGRACLMGRMVWLFPVRFSPAELLSQNMCAAAMADGV
jgi:hypothetical protein